MGWSRWGFSLPAPIAKLPSSSPRSASSLTLPMGFQAVVSRPSQGLSVGYNKALQWEKADMQPSSEGQSPRASVLLFLETPFFPIVQHLRANHPIKFLLVTDSLDTLTKHN